MADDFSFEIQKELGVVSEGKGGWQLELNLVSWSNRPAKYDLRSWAPQHEKMGKGLTLTQQDLIALRKLLDSLPEAQG
ncbi:MAG: YdbC family protein [Treponema sp.]|nr:YdbC family protein [Treponema sp.]